MAEKFSGWTGLIYEILRVSERSQEGFHESKVRGGERIDEAVAGVLQYN